MKYPIVYDKLATDFNNYGLAVLNNTTDPLITKDTKGTYTFTLKVPFNNKAQYIIGRNYIKVDGQFFIIQKVNKQGDDKKLVDIFCEHVSYELLDFPHFSEDIINWTYKDILLRILDGTPFTLHDNDFILNNYTDLFYDPDNGIGNARDMLFTFLSEIEAEVEFDNYDIYIAQSFGEDNGVQFRAGKNIKGIKDMSDTQVLCTRVIPIGKDGLDITSVNGGLPYRDADNIGDYKHPITHPLELREIDDPNELLAEADKYLEQYKYGNQSYEIDILELCQHPDYAQYADLEKVKNGDTVTIIHPTYGINIKARVVQYSYNPITKRNSKVVIANFRQNVTDLFQKYDKSTRTVSYAFQGRKLNKATLLGLTIEDYNGDLAFEIDAVTRQLKCGPGTIMSWGNLQDVPSDLAYAADIPNIDDSYFTHIGENYVFTGLVGANKILIGGENGYISFSQFETPPSANDVGARPYDWLPEYGEILGVKPPNDADNTYNTIGSQRLTYIDPYGIYTGVLTAQQINAIQGIQLGSNASILWGALPLDVASIGDIPDVPTTVEITQIAADYVQTPQLETNIGKVYDTLWVGSESTKGELKLYAYGASTARIYGWPWAGVGGTQIVYEANSHVFEGDVDFSYANVQGMNIVAKFG
ncbi:phage tail spike protein [Petroclostridium sp. X23]|uniref:phage tail spike protein n=1 Tax=Petroclostridium sp. X23 TaxID=3045146 RepID=UPI0024AD9A0C|nr:phage tail spike protein [Petroclostridium sp. X23]WHH59176.1 phage tail spike protein [Petroclostridium sp. X23]